MTRVGYHPLDVLSQISMFLLLGLLVFPSRLAVVWPLGLALAAWLALVARPVAVIGCLWPWRFPAREVAYVAWVGLRGAVPIVLATFPVMAGAPYAERLFHVVFFVVVASTVAQGGTVGWLTNRLGLAAPGAPLPPAVLEIASLRPLRSEIAVFYVDEALAAAGARIADLRFPQQTTAMLIVRGDELIAPKGHTVLRPGDHVYVLARPEDRPWLQLLLGRAEADDP